LQKKRLYLRKIFRKKEIHFLKLSISNHIVQQYKHFTMKYLRFLCVSVCIFVFAETSLSGQVQFTDSLYISQLKLLFKAESEAMARQREEEGKG